MRIRIVQLGIEEEVAANQARMTAALDTAQADEWIVFPEGVLSGYFPDRADYLSRLDAQAIERGIEGIGRIVLARKCNCLFGTALRHEGEWRNSVILLTSSGERHIHHKVELSALDRNVFTPGTQVMPYTVGDLTVGIQACRYGSATGSGAVGGDRS